MKRFELAMILLAVVGAVMFWNKQSAAPTYEVYSKAKSSAQNAVPAPKPRRNENAEQFSSQTEAPSANKPLKRISETPEDFFKSALAPQSWIEVIGKTTSLRMPVKKSNTMEFDGTMAGVFTGYLEGESGYTRVRVSTAYTKTDGAFTTSIYLQSTGGIEEANSENGLRQGNFGEDRYSLVFYMADERIIYLKYFITAEPYGERSQGSLRGWAYSPQSKTTQRIALKNQEGTPTVSEIRAIFPKTFLH